MFSKYSVHKTLSICQICQKIFVHQKCSQNILFTKHCQSAKSAKSAKCQIPNTNSQMPNDKHSNAKCQQHCHQALPPPGIKLNSIQHCHQALPPPGIKFNSIQHCHQAFPPPGIKFNSIQHCHPASNLIQHCRVKSALPDWTPTPKASPPPVSALPH